MMDNVEEYRRTGKGKCPYCGKRGKLTGQETEGPFVILSCYNKTCRKKACNYADKWRR